MLNSTLDKLRDALAQNVDLTNRLRAEVGRLPLDTPEIRKVTRRLEPTLDGGVAEAASALHLPVATQRAIQDLIPKE